MSSQCTLEMIPDFLQPQPTTTRSPHSHSEKLPDFLVPAITQVPQLPVDPKVTKELIEMQNEIMFEVVLEKVSSGISLTEVLKTDVRKPDVGAFLRWIHRDSKRKQRYYEAQEIGGELIAAEMIDISDGANSLEDVQRSTLRISTRKYLLGVWNKKRYGETKQIEINQSISITDALAAANSRVIEAEVIEVIENEQKMISHKSNNGEDE